LLSETAKREGEYMGKPHLGTELVLWIIWA